MQGIKKESSEKNVQRELFFEGLVFSRVRFEEREKKQQNSIHTSARAKHTHTGTQQAHRKEKKKCEKIVNVRLVNNSRRSSAKKW